MQITKGIKLAFGSRLYKTVFIIAAVAFLPVYIFAWNMILFPSMYVRSDLWTIANIILLALFSILSSMAITLSVVAVKTRISGIKGKCSFFAVIPSLLMSACPTCAPLLLSFASATYTIGLMLAEQSNMLRVLFAAILLTAIGYTSYSISNCEKCRSRFH